MDDIILTNIVYISYEIFFVNQASAYSFRVWWGLKLAE